MRVQRVGEATPSNAVWRLFGSGLDREAIPRLLSDPAKHLLVALSDAKDDLGEPGTPIGVVLGSEVTGADLAQEMYISYIAVDPMAQRLGVGSALMRSMLALARDRGCARVRGTIGPEQVGVVRAMTRMGAEAEERVSIDVSWQLTEPGAP